MWDIILHPNNMVFSISICLMLLLGIFEGLLLIVGTSTQGFLDQFVPDQLSDLQHHPEIETQADHSLSVKFLDWLYLGRIPVLVWLIIFLTTYGLTGFICQIIIFNISAHYLPAWIIAPVCLFLCMPLVRICAAIIAKILPKDETTAIHAEDLIGRKAIIVLGQAKQHSPAEAKVQDQFGQTHYILVEPESDIIFNQGQEVLLTQKTQQGFQAIEI